MKEIDVVKALQEKSPKIYHFLPGFIIRYLKSIIHQDEINDFIQKHGDKTGSEFTISVLDTLDITYNVEFEEPLDKSKRYILASNHPLGGPDGIILIDYFSRYFDKIIFPVNDILMQIENMSEFFIPINKHGTQSKEGARLMEESLASDSQILMFPAGLVSRKRKGVIKDLGWQKHFIAKAKKHQRDVIPVFFSGRNSNFFYNLANIRAFLGIKLNIEMLYLSNELFKQRGRNFTIKVGKPIKHNTFDNSKRPAEWASFVKEKVYNLK
ncbi:hypothetical protein C7377_1304 [Balneicella halophila]|uniref:Putative acyltransferase ACT14924-like acyltransferase domain-containing protein n=1 Tax=Balneicella halophila TaxID=1537566 RepID=A0A7L4UPK6_BALHA|nr:glycerol acyltransferase [Balneicella halophila]PVX50974.1 hypothetical protein C7377_1304 [Balneicella halophila]